ncbi:ornithine cyclodeaminase family protein [Gordonia jinhuaensis]|uniref:Ornithine cyclodeaminase n=1 Tax=Gordonia jinhuaensis TaxID=1517702 RepID=A0A916THH2_9ACTN|nr:ornithine cyclodeaminase family protein [Gordonia jinhuaensis]GGB45189.1 ornithine cyclodeaminase [Gordonia jinhuaensis]
MDIRFVTADEVAASVSPARAVEAIRAALCGGLDPAGDPARTSVPVASGQLLLMPSEFGDVVGTKIATVAPANPDTGLPRIQAVYVVIDGATLTPSVLIDGTALTTLRTPAVSVAAVTDHLRARTGPLRVAVFGAGPQGLGHVATLRDVLGDTVIGEVTYIVREPARAATPTGASAGDVVAAGSHAATEALRGADIVVTATGSAVPVFDSTQIASDAVVLAVGSHEPDRRELDTDLMSRAQVVVEDRATALRESGDIVMAVDEGTLTPDDLLPMAAVVTGSAPLTDERPVVFKSSGMSWEDAVVAATVAQATADLNSPTEPVD